MSSVKDKLPTISSALTAMCDGLEAGHTTVMMSSFGHKDSKGVCYGCAATNTILHAFDEVDINMLSTDHDGFEDSAYALVKGLERFEEVIDHARLGNLKSLFYYYGHRLEDVDDLLRSAPTPASSRLGPWYGMHDHNYLEEIPKVRAFVEELKKRRL